MHRGASRVATTLWGRNGLTLLHRVYLRSRVNLEKMPMNLTIKLPDEDVAALKAKATAQGITEEQYALQVWSRTWRPNGFANRGQPPRKPDWTSFPPIRLTRRLRQREKPGAKPTRTRRMIRVVIDTNIIVSAISYNPSDLRPRNFLCGPSAARSTSRSPGKCMPSMRYARCPPCPLGFLGGVLDVTPRVALG